MVTGSAVERIEAVVGPTRRRPAKNRLTAPTVETTAMPASQPKPVALTLAQVHVAAGGAGQRQRGRRAGADQRAQHERAHALGDALRA